MFTRPDGAFVFARWGRPIAPVVVGVLDETLVVIKRAFEAITTQAGHPMIEVDPERVSNCMIFFLRDWAELADVPDLDQMGTEVAPLIVRLNTARANRYQVFRFDDEGAIEAAFVFLRVDSDMADQPAEAVALTQVAQIMLVWSDAAFRDMPPLMATDGAIVVRPEITDLIRAAYDPVLPAMAREDSHALRLFARMGRAAG